MTVTIAAERISRQHLSQAVSFAVAIEDDIWEEIAGTLRWLTHTSDTVVLATEEDGQGAEEWELDLNHEVTVG